MTWTKITDTMPDDPRLLQLPRDVRWMHLEGLVWCNKHATDGHIPAYALRRVTDQDDPEDAAKLLACVGLWEATEEGWFIVVFADDQPSAADQERAKEYDRQRQRRHRMHKSGDHSICDPRYCEQASRVTSAVTPAVSHGSPTRPDPTRPEGEGRRGKGEGGSASSDGSAPLAASSPPPPSEPPRQPVPSWVAASEPPPDVSVWVDWIEIKPDGTQVVHDELKPKDQP